MHSTIGTAVPLWFHTLSLRRISSLYRNAYPRSDTTHSRVACKSIWTRSSQCCTTWSSWSTVSIKYIAMRTSTDFVSLQPARGTTVGCSRPKPSESVNGARRSLAPAGTCTTTRSRRKLVTQLTQKLLCLLHCGQAWETFCKQTGTT